MSQEQERYKCVYKELIPLHKLVSHKKNANKHSPEQIDRLAKIIDFQGQRSPIVVSTLSGFIVKGHGRLEAIRKLGWESAAVDYQDYESEAQEYADLIADNEIARWAHTDLAMVNMAIMDFGPDLDIDILGIKDFTIEPMEKMEIEDILQDDLNKKFIIEVTFPNEMELADIRDDLSSRGYIVKEK